MGKTDWKENKWNMIIIAEVTQNYTGPHNIINAWEEKKSIEKHNYIYIIYTTPNGRTCNHKMNIYNIFFECIIVFIYNNNNFRNKKKSKNSIQNRHALLFVCLSLFLFSYFIHFIFQFQIIRAVLYYYYFGIIGIAGEEHDSILNRP